MTEFLHAGDMLVKLVWLLPSLSLILVATVVALQR